MDFYYYNKSNKRRVWNIISSWPCKKNIKKDRLFCSKAYAKTNKRGFCKKEPLDPLYLSKSKKKAKTEKGIIVYIDEVSFRQTHPLYQTWVLRNSQPKIPTKGVRNT